MQERKKTMSSIYSFTNNPSSASLSCFVPVSSAYSSPFSTSPCFVPVSSAYSSPFSAPPISLSPVFATSFSSSNSGFSSRSTTTTTTSNLFPRSQTSLPSTGCSLHPPLSPSSTNSSLFGAPSFFSSSSSSATSEFSFGSTPSFSKTSVGFASTPASSSSLTPAGTSSDFHFGSTMPAGTSSSSSSASFWFETRPSSASLQSSSASSSGAAFPNIGFTKPIAFHFGTVSARSTSSTGMTTNTAGIFAPYATPSSSSFTPALFYSQASTSAVSTPVVRASGASTSSSSMTTTTLTSAIAGTASSSAMGSTAASSSQLQSTSAASAIIIDRFQCRSAISLSEVVFDFLCKDVPSLPPDELPKAEGHIENSLRSIQLLGVDTSVLRASVDQIIATAREVCQSEKSLDSALIKEILTLQLSKLGKRVSLFTSLFEEQEQTLTTLRRKETSEAESIQNFEAVIASLKVKLEDAIKAKDTILREIEVQKVTMQETKDHMKKAQDEEVTFKGKLHNLEAKVAQRGQDLKNKRTHLKELLDSLPSLAWI